MSLSWLATNFVAAFLLPPLNLLLVGGLGLWLLKRRRPLGQALVGACLLGLWLLSTPLVADALLDSLKPPPAPLTGTEADAIVILGGGRNKASLEYGGDTLNRFSLERLRYGAKLARQLNKPVLVTGGAPDGGVLSEGEILRAALQDEFGVRANWVETRSLDTRENARFSAELLKRDGVHRVYLVTHAWHLKRAVPEFRAAGLEVVPAGTGHFLNKERIPLDFLPRASALEQSYLALHEWIGLVWYRIRN